MSAPVSTATTVAAIAFGRGFGSYARRSSFLLAIALAYFSETVRRLQTALV